MRQNLEKAHVARIRKNVLLGTRSSSLSTSTWQGRYAGGLSRSTEEGVHVRRARNPRWEPGMGMIPDPRQIGNGGGDGPPIPGKSRMGMGMDPRSPANPSRGSGMGMIPDCRRVPSRALHLLNG